jgi:hypothetical protein
VDLTGHFGDANKLPARILKISPACRLIGPKFMGIVSTPGTPAILIDLTFPRCTNIGNPNTSPYSSSMISNRRGRILVM